MACKKVVVALLLTVMLSVLSNLSEAGRKCMKRNPEGSDCAEWSNISGKAAYPNVLISTAIGMIALLILH
ncbi:hypothetical protein AXF42_Ash021638 [Apostasia shenzhenica]|uniref:Uncharacterized protein n=1 Tax=Apostasia shenzhenica TaxID=1088818 RepID=A0A2I0A080_9ASPA|nr:hypothetical protein AXF42_Ash021638 [Apostasia shenzhenica]